MNILDGAHKVVPVGRCAEKVFCFVLDFLYKDFDFSMMISVFEGLNEII